MTAAVAAAGARPVTGADSRPRLAGLVLAAGAATRFGGAKQLAVVAGRSLVERAAELALDCCAAGVVVVTGAHAGGVEAALVRLSVRLSAHWPTRLPVRVAHNGAWVEGLAGSLRCGLDALPVDADACLILLCDQPAITAADLAALVAAWRGAPEQMAAAHYGGSAGVPAIFPRSTWPGLAQLRGDRGARGLLAAASSLTTVDMPSAAHDIDTLADLDRLRGG